MTMERITLRVPEAQLDELERHVEAGHFPNRSEGIRTAIRDMLDDRPDPGRPTGELWELATMATEGAEQ